MLLENNPYPQDSRVRQEASTLVEAGYRVTVICPRAQGQRQRETVAGVRVRRFPAPPEAAGVWGYLLEYSYAMLAAGVLSLVVFVREGFDVIHAHNPPDTFVFIAAFYKLLGKRFIYDHHDLAPEMYRARLEGRGNRLIYHTLVVLERLSCRLANHVIATNESYKTLAVQRGGVPAERVSVVRNGPEERVRPSLEPTQVDADIVLGYVGVMGVQDGLDYLLRALHHLRFDLNRTNFRCILIGSGDALEALEALAKQLKLGEHIQFAGWLSGGDLAQMLSTADICVVPDPSNPYTDRSTMIKVTEYMALAKPIVAFDLPEHRYTAQGAALYARPNDEYEFARALAYLMDHPAERRSMGEAGRKRVEAALSWRHSAPHLLQAYRNVLNISEEGALR